MQNIVSIQGNATVTLAANEKIAVYTAGTATVYQLVGYPNLPTTKNLLTTVTAGQYVSSAFTSGATLIIEAGALPALYEIGTAPQVQSIYDTQYQPAPGTLNATGTLTAALALSGIVTSTTAAAVTATLDTGALFESASDFAVNDSFDWCVINTGPNAFTVAASTGHTIVGAAAVATATSGRFRTRKTAASTFVTYRMA